MANAATGQMIKMVPLFILAIGIAIFFSLVQKIHKKQPLVVEDFSQLPLSWVLSVYFLNSLQIMHSCLYF